MQAEKQVAPCLRLLANHGHPEHQHITGIAHACQQASLLGNRRGVCSTAATGLIQKPPSIGVDSQAQGAKPASSIETAVLSLLLYM